MTYRQSLHVNAPVEKVFGFVKDPSNWRLVAPEGIVFKDVVLTEEGVGTHYSWVARIAGLPVEGFGVFTEFVPNRRIVDRSSRSFEGTWTYSFEPDGPGTRLTVTNESGSLWRLPLLSALMDRAAARTHAERITRIKSLVEA